MIPFVGHGWVRAALEDELPAVVLLQGPSSVGKWTLAEYLADYHGVKPYDRRVLETVSAEDAREVKRFVSTAAFGKLKLVIANLDAANASALNALLKTLEEPPPNARFILVASQPTLTTIASRASLYRLGLLSTSEVAEVLVRRLGWREMDANTAATRSGGSVEGALSATLGDASKAQVISVVRALKAQDRDLLLQATRSWGEDEQRALYAWAWEGASGRWSMFVPADTQGLDPDVIRRVLFGLNKLANARPRMQVRTVLESLIR